jgi:hypothetical protein
MGDTEVSFLFSVFDIFPLLLLVCESEEEGMPVSFQFL